MAKTEIRATAIKDGSIYDIDIAPDAGIDASKISTSSDYRFVTDEQVNLWNQASVNDTQIITVAKQGGAFTSIKAAMDSITDASTTNRYTISVSSGVYIEPEIHMKPHVVIHGTSYLQTIIEPQDPLKNLINAAPSSSIFQCMLRGVTGVDKSAVYYSGGSGTFRLDSVRFGANTQYVNMNSSLAPCIGIVTRCSAESDAATTLGFKFTNPQGSPYPVQAVVEDFILNTNLSTIVDIMELSGLNTQVLVNKITLIKSSKTGEAFRAYNGAELRVNVANLSGFNIGVHNPNIGSGSMISLNSVVMRDMDQNDVLLSNPLTKGSLTGVFDTNKVNIDASISGLSANYTDTVNHKVVQLGDFYVGDNLGSLTGISDILNEGFPVGLYQGGEMRQNISNPLTIDIEMGYGYLRKGVYPSRILARYEWKNTSLLLSPNSVNYIYINESNIITTSPTHPSPLYNNIVLGKVVTTFSGIEFIEKSSIVAKDVVSNLIDFNKSGIGSLYESGSIVSIYNSSMIAVSAGVYFYGSKRHVLNGKDASIPFYHYYRNNQGGFSSNQTPYLLHRYDNGNGELASAQTNTYVKSSMYVVGSGVNERYMVVAGTTLYSSLIEAEAGDLPNPPSYFNDSCVLIASLITSEDGVIAKVFDERPIIGTKNSGIASSAYHGNLLGLDNDDHPQYFKKTGDNMNGNIDMGGNEIKNAGLINGITVSSHYTRHLPNGTDPLPTGVAVSIGDNNLEGVANKFSRNDHVHAHGNRTNPNDHAVATVSSAGFMSSTDKMKLDGLSYYTHPTGFENVPAAALTGANVVSQVLVNTSGHTTGVNTRVLTAADIGASATGHVHAVATIGSNGFMSYTDKMKLDYLSDYAHPTGFENVPAAALTGANVVSQVLVNASGHTTGVNTRVLTAADIGASATGHVHAVATTGADGFMSSADKTKLNGIATSATANSTDAQLRDRATHTGTQAISTVTGLQTALDGTVNITANQSIGGMKTFTGTTTFSGLVNVNNELQVLSTAYVQGSVIADSTLSVASTISEGGSLLSSKYAGVSHVHAVATTGADGFMSSTDKTKLNGIATSATANSTDAQLRDRTTHTGTQAISTVTGLQTALDTPKRYTNVVTTVSQPASPYTPNVNTPDLLDITLTPSVTTTFITPSWGGGPVTDGRRVMVRLRQTGAGSGLISWDAGYNFPSGTAPVLTTTSGKHDLLGFMYNGVSAKWDLIAMTKNL
jgi:hypothetical protein